MDTEDNSRSLESIFEEFMLTLDDAIGTFKATKKENKRVNQLLFSYIVNNFDSFIGEYLNISIYLIPRLREEYFKKGKKDDANITVKEIVKISSSGLNDWMLTIAAGQLDKALRNKRHSEKIELLFQHLEIKEERYVCLSGGGKAFASGCLKKTATTKSKRSINHQTTSEEIVGYADIIFEKRNAITHHRGKYTEKVIKRLNETWKLEIKDNRPVIKRGTIRSIIRFYTSIAIFLLENSKYVDFEIEKYIENFNKLKSIENIKLSGGVKDKFLIRKKQFIENFNKERFTSKTYMDKFSVSYSTTIRDFKKYQEDINFEVTQGGKGNGHIIQYKK